MISTVAALSAFALLILGLIFLLLKIFRKDLDSSAYGILYRVHFNAPKFALLLALLHGFTVQPLEPTNYPSGWILVISLFALAVLGVYLGIKNNSKPMDEEADTRWKTLRIAKWIVTVVIVLFLVLHASYVL